MAPPVRGAPPPLDPVRLTPADDDAATGAPAELIAVETKRRKRGKRGRGAARRRQALSARIRRGETPEGVLDSIVRPTTGLATRIDRALDVRGAAWQSGRRVDTVPVDERLGAYYREGGRRFVGTGADGADRVKSGMGWSA